MSSAAPQPRFRAAPAAESALTRARLRVVPRTRARAPRVPFLLLVSLVLVSGVVGLLMFNTHMQQDAFASTALEQQAASLTAREQTLRMELEALRDPQRVASQAQRMGMVLPTEWCTLRLSGADQPCHAAVAVAGSGVRLNPLPPVKPAALDPKPIIVRTPRHADTTPGSAVAAGNRGRNGAETRPHRGHDRPPRG